MNQKPSTCQGCPLFEDGEGFVADSIPENAQVIVVSAAPTTYELRVGVTAEGYEFEKHYAEYLIRAGQVVVGFTHLIRCRGRAGAPMPKGRHLSDGQAFCRRHDKPYPDTVELVVLNGASVTKATTDIKDPREFRGYLVPEGVDNV